jgi:Na+-transporting methylmalonyl-CoA/oxaloacetate decarboxylase gamma subunit
MSENLSLALQITLVGMGIVFAAIILLGLVMAVLVRLTADKPEAAGEESAAGEALPGATPGASAADAQQARRRAAAAAVAIALAQQADHSQPHAFPLPPTSLVSAWQAVMRTRILNKRGPTR